MKKLIAVVAAGVVLSGVALGMSTEAQAASAGEAMVEAKIDARLHQLLVKARRERIR